MKALVLENGLHVKDIDVPQRSPGEALIRVLYSGICATDRELAKGYMEFTGVPGHEFVGIVQEAEDDSLIGKRVVGEINCECGECYFCKNGNKRHCPERSVLGIYNKQGTFAEYITLPEKNLFVVPDSVSNVESVFTEPLAACLEIFEQVHISPNERIAVIGDGKLAQLIVRMLAVNGYSVTVYGRHSNKLKLLSDFSIMLGEAEETGTRYDIVIEASGNPAGFELAASIVRPRGKIIQKSTYNSSIEVDISRLVVDEISLIGSRCGRFEPAIRLIQQKVINVMPLIDSIYPFDKVLDAFKRASEPGAMKIIVKISE